MPNITSDLRCLPLSLIVRLTAERPICTSIQANIIMPPCSTEKNRVSAFFITSEPALSLSIHPFMKNKASPSNNCISHEIIKNRFVLLSDELYILPELTPPIALSTVSNPKSKTAHLRRLWSANMICINLFSTKITTPLMYTPKINFDKLNSLVYLC